MDWYHKVTLLQLTIDDEPNITKKTIIILHPLFQSHQESYLGENDLRKINYLLNYLNLCGVDNNGILQYSFWYTQLDKDCLNNNYQTPHATKTIIGLVKHHLAVMCHHTGWGSRTCPAYNWEVQFIGLLKLTMANCTNRRGIYNIGGILLTKQLISCFQKILFFILILSPFLF